MSYHKNLMTVLNDVEELFEIVDEVQLSKTYRIGGWTVKEMLHHLADAQSVLLYRIKRVSAEGHQLMKGFNQDLWADNLNYSSTSLELSKRLFEISTLQIIELSKTKYQNSDKVFFEHNETGRRSLKDEFDKVISHIEGHLNQIERALQ